MRTPLLVVASLVAVGVISLLGAELAWRSATAKLVGRLGASDPEPRRFRVAELESLPAPVARYLGKALRDGQPIVGRARLDWEGVFLVRPEAGQWGPFTAVQDLAASPPGFVWDARIAMAPGVGVRVRDGLVEGAGSMRASLLGLFPLVASEGTSDLARGALHRYVAEAVWCPTSLLPSQGVRWSHLDEHTARAMLEVGGTTVTLDFRFGEDGMVRNVFAADRARDVGGKGVPTPWQGRFSDFEERSGMQVPTSGEVEWLLPAGPLPYWRGHLRRIRFDFDSIGVLRSRPS